MEVSASFLEISLMQAGQILLSHDSPVIFALAEFLRAIIPFSWSIGARGRCLETARH